MFGVVTRLPITPLDLADQRVRFYALATAKEEIVKVVALDQITRALKFCAPVATTMEIKIGYEVLVYREMTKECDGPCIVSNVKSKVVFVKAELKDKQFSIDKVRPFLRTADLTLSTNSHHDIPLDGLHMPSSAEGFPSLPPPTTVPTTPDIVLLYQHVKSDSQPDPVSNQPARSEPQSLSNAPESDLLPHTPVSATPSSPTYKLMPPIPPLTKCLSETF